MHLITIAWRNLKRHGLRTGIALLAVAAVVLIVIFSRGFVKSLTESSFRLYIDNMYGHVRITTEEYALREMLLPLDHMMDGFNSAGISSMVEELEQHSSVRYVMPRVRFGAMASRDDDMVRMMGIGIDVERERTYGALAEDISSGRMIKEGNEILVGSGLMEDLKAEVGDRVTLVFSDAFQSLRGRTFQIVGVRDSGVSDLDNVIFYVPLDTAQDMLWLDDEASELLVYTYSTDTTEALLADMRTLLHKQGSDEYLAVPWNQANPFVEMYSEMDNIMFAAYLLFVVMGTIVVVSTLTMIVRERTAEIGMMSALGLSSREIMGVFILEGFFIGVIGSLIGSAVGGLLTLYYSQAGFYVEAFDMFTSEADILIEPVFYLSFSMENLVFSFIMGTVVVTLASFLPAFKAAKLEPVDALHYGDD